MSVICVCVISLRLCNRYVHTYRHWHRSLIQEHFARGRLFRPCSSLIPSAGGGLKHFPQPEDSIVTQVLL